jgi:hypothetical protein
MIDEEAQATIDKVASICWNWLEFNDSSALELDDQGYGDADEFGMHTLSSCIVALWNMLRSKVVVQPPYDKQQWFGIVAGSAAMWERDHRGENEFSLKVDTDAGIGLHTLNVTYLRLYHECIQRRIVVPPTHITTSKVH